MKSKSRSDRKIWQARRRSALAVGAVFGLAGLLAPVAASNGDGVPKSNTLIAVETGSVVNASPDKSAAEVAPLAGSVRLVLQVTIDQLRGDLPRIFKRRFGKGGFRYLMDNGVYYVNANYTHADTETGPGHATLVTGGQPAQHGIIGGDWWDEANKKLVYSVEDDKYRILSNYVEKDPAKSNSGRSPANLESTTIADEIYIASEHRAKIFAVSGKDRSAIIPGGRVGKAFWLSQGDFVTSEFYYKEIPGWLKSWNDRKLADSYKGKSWDLLHDRKSYWRANRDDMPWEGTFAHLGRTMPKSLDNQDKEKFYRGLDYTVVSDELVLAFTKDLITREKLGQNETPDYLSVSFSSTDLVGHTWGVNSLEAEDNVLRVDRNLEDLFSFIDKNIGLDKTLIVLSADHGVADVSEYMQSLNYPAKRIDPQEFPKRINEALKKKFATDADLLQIFVYPYLYLNVDQIQILKLNLAEVESFAATEAMKYPGIAFAATRSDIISGRMPFGHAHMPKIGNTFHAKRSGSVHIVTDQHAVLMHYPWNLKTGLHGSVYSYDTFVPIMFAAPGLKAKEVSRPVGPHDIAPTIATFLGIKPPSGSVGVPLSEIVDDRTNSGMRKF
ncbi:MAG: alkaline phosphatase family protein [Candidatus Melainabacteria bacterium]|nr:alkaline phosphatase family protein [Candidatus Melainabacteria bacterium]